MNNTSVFFGIFYQPLPFFEAADLNLGGGFVVTWLTNKPTSSGV